MLLPVLSKMNSSKVRFEKSNTYPLPMPKSFSKFLFSILDRSDITPPTAAHCIASKFGLVDVMDPNLRGHQLMQQGSEEVSERDMLSPKHFYLPIACLQSCG